jgi:hypothetical protein
MARTKAQGLSNSPSTITPRTVKDNSSKLSSKDKGKEPVVNSVHDPEILEGSPDTLQPWSWVTLADPSPSKVSPLISNDGRYVALKAHLFSTCLIVVV